MFTNILELNLYYRGYKGKIIKVKDLEEYNNNQEDSFINLLSFKKNKSKEFVVGDIYIHSLTSEIFIFGLNTIDKSLESIGFYRFATLNELVKSIKEKSFDKRYKFIKFNTLKTKDLIFQGNYLVSEYDTLSNLLKYFKRSKLKQSEIADLLETFSRFIYFINELKLIDIESKESYYTNSLGYEYSLKENKYELLLGIKKDVNNFELKLNGFENNIYVLKSSYIINKLGDKLIPKVMFKYDTSKHESVLLFDNRLNSSNISDMSKYLTLSENLQFYMNFSSLDNEDKYCEYLINFI